MTYSNSHRKINRNAAIRKIIKEISRMPTVHRVTEEPSLENYQLSSRSRGEIESFNNLQDAKKKFFGKIVFVTTLLACLLSYFDEFALLRIVWIFLVCVPYNFLGVMWLSNKLYPTHTDTERLHSFDSDVAAYQRFLETKKRDFWKNLSGHRFEHEVGKLLCGYFSDVKITPGSGDGGVDIIAWKEGLKIIIQCKNHKKPVGPEPVRALVGVLQNFNANKAMMISTNGYTTGAVDFARFHNSVTLFDLEDILKWSDGSSPKI